MDKDPIGTASREMQRLARLGDSPYVCILCGCTDPVTLIRVRADWLEARGAPRNLFHDHHIVGENHDPDLTVLICRNCHAKATEGLLRAGVSMMEESDRNTREALRLEGLAEFHEDVAAALRRWAEEKRISKGPNG